MLFARRLGSPTNPEVLTQPTLNLHLTDSDVVVDALPCEQIRVRQRYA